MAGSGRPESRANHSLIPLDRCLPGSPPEFGGLQDGVYDEREVTPLWNRYIWDGPVLWTKLIRVPFQGECTAVVAAWVAV